MRPFEELQSRIQNLTDWIDGQECLSTLLGDREIKHQETVLHDKEGREYIEP